MGLDFPCAKLAAFFGILSVVAWFVMSITVGSYMIHESNHYNSDTFPIINNIVDIPQDWSATPLVEINIVDYNQNCGINQIHVFERIWFGTTIGCMENDRSFKVN